ncbi:MAG: carbohydrate-binding protein [Clostridia bacterium]|nr:carbohydrate-binding protein [Clostridia bacterium]
MAEVREFKSRFGEQNKLEKMRAANHPDGVTVDPIPASRGEEITVLYYGPLAQNGASQLWMHTGYGPANQWSEVKDLPMEKTGRGWVAVVGADRGDRLNFCFHDNTGRWDNNQGRNWSLEIHEGGRV